MVSVKECAAFARLAPNKMLLGATPSKKHRILLSSYLLCLWRGPRTVRGMIVSDIDMWLDLGMHPREFSIKRVDAQLVENGRIGESPF